MKTIVLISFLFLCGCTQEHTPQSTDCMVVLLDITDSLAAVSNVSAASLFSFLDCSSESNAGATITCAPLTNMTMNKAYTASLGGESWYMSNELTRKKALDSFKQQVAQNLNHVRNAHIGIDGSAIFSGLAFHLKTLATCTACATRRLVVISDLRENSEVFNAYDTSKLARIGREPRYLTNLLEKKYSLESLVGITVMFIHQPTTTESDRAFSILAPALKEYLERKGAVVEINASLP